MPTATQDDRDFWRGELLAGGPTTVPRWTLDPVPGTAAHVEPLPEDLVGAVGRRAGELGVPLSSVLLAAHGAVLAALSGEREVLTGWVPGADGDPLPCRLTTGVPTWRDLVAEAHRAAGAVAAHAGFPVAALRRELGLSGPSFETVLDAGGPGRALPADAVLAVGLRVADHGPVLRLRYRTDVLDADCAARVAGYHRTALALLAADPDAGHAQQSLLSAAERRHQLEDLAGPRRELPDRRFHELFAERVRRHPDAVAVVCGAQQWTYRELDARADRLGRALLARGLHREEVVAVVTERDLDWAAAVLAVLRAGGVYLPVEPHFPADRIATMLRRAGCRLVLTEPGSTATLDRALETLPGVRRVLVDDACAEEHPGPGPGAGPGVGPGVEVGADQLAYVYFTSGSTGEPKGAMCEHAGMLNHLLAKIEDLGIGERDVVAQTAPQCFDISLWQLVAAWLVGGRTLLVPQDVVLDAERFLDTVTTGRVTVLQVVPSYLDVLLALLERRPRELPDLHAVSVTGEALKGELARRWAAARPGVRLVNAYGLTETSDDTNHEVLDRAPEGDRVPLGRPVRNVRVYVVDDQLEPVPLGAPGAIVFSGVCVGRGYLNDPERTRLAFSADPHRPGERLYQAGDVGRWRPDGKLEFLGRRDSQVKIAGFRIEIGDVENALLRVPGVRDGAVVVAEREGGGRQLVAFCAGPDPVGADVLRERLAAALPPYMVPAAFHWGPRLPLTANGKTDRATLTALAADLAVGAERAGPETPTERWLARAWATVLGIGVDEIGRRDSFFDRGGTSLQAVKLAVTVDRAVSLTDLTRHPVLADLAALVDARRAAELVPPS